MPCSGHCVWAEMTTELWMDLREPAEEAKSDVFMCWCLYLVCWLILVSWSGADALHHLLSGLGLNNVEPNVRRDSHPSGNQEEMLWFALAQPYKAGQSLSPSGWRDATAGVFKWVRSLAHGSGGGWQEEAARGPGCQGDLSSYWSLLSLVFSPALSVDLAWDSLSAFHKGRSLGRVPGWKLGLDFERNGNSHSTLGRLSLFRLWRMWVLKKFCNIKWPVSNGGKVGSEPDTLTALCSANMVPPLPNAIRGQRNCIVPAGAFDRSFSEGSLSIGGPCLC